jgi:hypothetical protein
MTTAYRARIVLKVKRDNTASVLERSHAIRNGMAADPQRYLAPVPSIFDLDGQITKVDHAQQLAATRVVGSAAARNVERAVLVAMLEMERGYVQTLCDASPDKAVAIAQGAGMFVAGVGIRENPLLAAVPGAAPGSVILDANATALVGKGHRRVFFNWQWTTDGGQSFHGAPPTPIGKTTLEGLPTLTMVGFRVSATTTSGPGEWSPVVSILVL